MSGGKKGGKMKVADYYMSLHYGIAAGPLDEIRAVLVNDKEAWKGSLSDYAEVSINKPDLFGGPKKEGGLRGRMTYLPGNAGQVMPEFLANKLGLTSDTCPAYRGISSLFFTGNGNRDGFYWTTNSPYIGGTHVLGRRRPKVLNQSIAMIDGNDANPIHVIFEAMTNTDWGIGAPTSAFDVATFEACAQTCFDEKFGISILWTEQQDVETFVSNILTYVDGVVYVNPKNGLLSMRLIRFDYDPATLPVYDEKNMKLSNFQRKLWGETVNEIVVTWTNPENEQKETVSAQDLANIAMQGGIVSDANPYEGVRNADLAMRLATRDLRVASSPLMSCEATIDRSGYDITPGAVIKVSWKRHGMVEVIMRVGQVDYGKIGDSQIRVSLIEDVFSLDSQAYETPPGSSWIDPSEVPAPLSYTLPFTLPYYAAVNMGDGNTVAAMTPGRVLVGVLGGQPGQDTQEFILASEGADPLGNPVIGYGTALSITSRATISTALTFAVSSITTILGPTQGDSPAPGFLAILGTNDRDMEICVITNVVGNVITLRRGVLDTIPRAWPAGSQIWIVGPDSVIDDESVHIADVPLIFRALPVTSSGRLDYAAAPDILLDVTNRPWMPSRPANVKVNGLADGLLDATTLPSVTVTWNNRNRVMEDSVILDWDDATVAPESGQTTSILIADPVTGTVANRIDGLTGTSYALSTGDFGGLAFGRVKVISRRDGLDSLQGHGITVRVKSGYGYAYGLGYGN